MILPTNTKPKDILKSSLARPFPEIITVFPLDTKRLPTILITSQILAVPSHVTFVMILNRMSIAIVISMAN